VKTKETVKVCQAGISPAAVRPMALAVPERSDVLWVLDVLEETWRMEKLSPVKAHEDPLDGLIVTILSQNTNDKNRDRAFAQLKSRFSSWEETAASGIEELASTIRAAGLGEVKARYINQALKGIKERFGEYSLKGMKSWDKDKAKTFLLSLPGVGPKTAACVLLFELGQPAFPVDTHITRVCKRIGWAPWSATPEDVQSIMEAVIPQERYYGAHLNIIEHGRHICTARKPACPSCPVISCCEFAEKTQRGEG
jgi:endonuclease-3